MRLDKSPFLAAFLNANGRRRKYGGITWKECPWCDFTLEIRSSMHTIAFHKHIETHPEWHEVKEEFNVERPKPTSIYTTCPKRWLADPKP